MESIQPSIDMKCRKSDGIEEIFFLKWIQKSLISQQDGVWSELDGLM